MIVVYRVIGIAVFALWLSPVLHGLVDGWWWLMVGSQLTDTTWDVERVIRIVIWLFLLVLPAVILAGWAFDAANQEQDALRR